jgi:hypothetical protein
MSRDNHKKYELAYAYVEIKGTNYLIQFSDQICYR